MYIEMQMVCRTLIQYIYTGVRTFQLTQATSLLSLELFEEFNFTYSPPTTPPRGSPRQSFVERAPLLIAAEDGGGVAATRSSMRLRVAALTAAFGCGGAAGAVDAAAPRSASTRSCACLSSSLRVRWSKPHATGSLRLSKISLTENGLA